MRRAYLKEVVYLTILALICINLLGCGETFGGVGKDVRRMGRGVKTIFVRDGAD